MDDTHYRHSLSIRLLAKPQYVWSTRLTSWDFLNTAPLVVQEPLARGGLSHAARRVLPEFQTTTSDPTFFADSYPLLEVGGYFEMMWQNK